MSVDRIKAKDRVANGLCPTCGKEAAPYRLCFDCRQLLRLTRGLKRGAKLGVFNSLGGQGKNALWSINKNAPADAADKLRKWGTPWHLPDSDRRSHPRMRGIRVDVEATLIKVMEFIGRPATIEEILSAWGRLRDRRSAPLANDLGRIIIAADKRAAKQARRAAAWQKSQMTAPASDTGNLS